MLNIHHLQAELREQELEERLKEEVKRPAMPKTSTASKPSGSKQSKLLLGAVKKRGAAEKEKNDDEAKKAKVEEEKKPASASGGGLGALAGLGEYSSSEEDDS